MSDIQEPCRSCGGRCCNRFAVYVTSFDMKRISEYLSVHAKEFVMPQKSNEITHSGEPLVFIFDEKGKLGEYALVLRRQRNNECIFYRNEKGCAVYPARPAICRSYPFGKESNGGVGYTKPFACWRRWEMGEYDEGNARREIEKRERELREYGVIVRRWNVNDCGLKPARLSRSDNASIAALKQQWVVLFDKPNNRSFGGFATNQMLCLRSEHPRGLRTDASGTDEKTKSRGSSVKKAKKGTIEECVEFLLKE